MKYVKAVSDTYSDEAEVLVYEGGAVGPFVHLEVPNVNSFEFTPKQARRLAKALRKAAKIAEENA